MLTWIVVLSGVAAVVVLTVWVGTRQRRMSGTDSGNDRLGVRDPRDTPWGPSGSF